VGRVASTNTMLWMTRRARVLTCTGKYQGAMEELSVPPRPSANTSSSMRWMSVSVASRAACRSGGTPPALPAAAGPRGSAAPPSSPAPGAVPSNTSRNESALFVGYAGLSSHVSFSDQEDRG